MHDLGLLHMPLCPSERQKGVERRKRLPIGNSRFSDSVETTWQNALERAQNRGTVDSRRGELFCITSAIDVSLMVVRLLNALHGMGEVELPRRC